MKELCSDGTYREVLEEKFENLQHFLNYISSEDFTIEIVNYGEYEDVSEIPVVLLNRKIFDIVRQGIYNKWHYTVRLKV